MASLQAGDCRKLMELVAQLLQQQGPECPDARVTALLRDAFQVEFAGAGKIDFHGSAATRGAMANCVLTTRPLC